MCKGKLALLVYPGAMDRGHAGRLVSHGGGVKANTIVPPPQKPVGLVWLLHSQCSIVGASYRPARMVPDISD